jgi:hypothetical protein
MEGLIAAASEVTPARVATSAADIDSTRDRIGVFLASASVGALSVFEASNARAVA